MSDGARLTFELGPDTERRLCEIIAAITMRCLLLPVAGGAVGGSPIAGGLGVLDGMLVLAAVVVLVGYRRARATDAEHLGQVRAMGRRLALLGSPSGAGACGVGQERAPAALRGAGLSDSLGGVGFDVRDFGDLPVVPWRPDRARPRAQNLDAVVQVVRSTATRVADALLERERTVLVLGGDCTVGIGTIAGARSALGDFAVLYFDLHSDLNTPASARDGALDWMALAHVLALQGTEPTLAAATGPAPLLEPGRVVLFAQNPSNATRFERAEIERLGLAHIALEEVRPDPEGAARRALALLATRSDRYLIHLDLDVVDFTDAPLSEHPSRNTGLKLDEMLRALRVLTSDPGLVGITLTELNPHNAAADDGLLERFAASFAAAIS